MTFELERESGQVVRAGEAFWVPAGGTIHHQGCQPSKRRMEQPHGGHDEDRSPRSTSANSAARRAQMPDRI